MKQVQYRGMVTFDIPDNWQEDTDDDTAGLYYDDNEHGGLLQLSLTTADNANPVTTDMLRSMLDSLTAAKTKTLETLSNGSVLMSYVTPNREDGQLRVIFFWILAGLAAPNSVRIANFSYTLPAAHAAGLGAQKTVAQLDKSVHNAVFTPLPSTPDDAQAE